MPYDSNESDSDDDDEDGNGVSVNQGPIPQVTTRSGRSLIPPDN
jgi:hypothetical protein